MVARTVRAMIAAGAAPAAMVGKIRCRITSIGPPPPTILVMPVAGSQRQVSENSSTSSSPNQ